MDLKLLMTWFCTVSCILVLVGILFSSLGFGVIAGVSESMIGLNILPADKDRLLSWESAIYGAIMIGWGVTLFLIGRLAFRRKDADLMKIMLYGIFIWLAIEAIFSAYLGVLFNVGVDVAVFAVFSLPLIFGIRHLKGGQLGQAKP